MIALEDSPASSFNHSQFQQSDVDQREVPLNRIVSGVNNEEDTTIEENDDECDEDCESFCPVDLMSFAWQIARGMVSNLLTKREIFIVSIYLFLSPVSLVFLL